jgi:hypothetical protein
MSFSEKERRKNLELALQLIMQDLGEPYAWQEHDAASDKFTAVHRTTWEELARRGLVKPHSFYRYWLTGSGWIAGLKAIGQWSDPEFLSKAGLLSEALKRKIDGRQECGLTDRTKLAQETNLSEFFVYDVIDSHLLRELFRRIDATWAPDDRMKNYIDIPPDFGLPILN